MSVSGAVPVSSAGRFGWSGRAQRVSLAAAVAGGIAIVIGSLVVPVYQSSGTQGSGDQDGGSATLVGVNGWGALLVAGVPLAATLAAGSALGRRAGQRGAGAFAWGVAMLLAVVNLLAMASIGMFLLPVTAALIVACAAHRGREAAAEADAGDGALPA